MRLSDEDLGRELQAMRPAPAPAFAAKLDQRVADGFPRAEQFQGVRRLFSRPPRQLVARAAMAATFLVVTGVALVEADLGGNEATQAPPQPIPQAVSTGAAEPAPSAGGVERRLAPDRAAYDRFNNTQGAVALTQKEAIGRLAPATGGGVAAHQLNRDLEKNAQMTLATTPDDVPDVADDVVRVTHSFHGIVVTSNVSHGEDKARADFQLALPSARLDAALAELSGLAHVQSLDEGQVDITAQTTHVERHLQEVNARLASLRTRLTAAQAAGDTVEAARLEREISAATFEQRQVERQLADYRRRATFATVGVTVVSDASAADDGWTLDDAVDDAGDVLRYAAGVIVVSAAVLLPVALLAALFAIAWRAWVRHRREAALGE